MKKPHKIAIVDPHQELARAYQKRLALEGFEVYVFDNAQEATSVLIELPFDAVITELQLPDIGFEDFYDSINRSSFTYNLPVIVLTTNDLDSQRGWSHLADLDNYFVKSKTHPDEIIDRLRYLLRT